MKDVLLIGNGVNRLSEGISWGDLLNKLAGKPCTELEQKIRKEKPFTLLFDEIITQSDENEIKSRIANVFTEINIGKTHKHSL